MELTLPEVPAGVVTLLGLFTPYGTALLNGFIHLTGVWKRVVSVAVALAVAAISLVIYYSATGDNVPNLVGLLLLAVVVSQTSYALVTKNTAKAIEDTIAVGSLTRRDERPRKDNGHSTIPGEKADGPSLADVGGWLEHPSDPERVEDLEPEEGDAEPVLDDEQPTIEIGTGTYGELSRDRRGDHRAD